MNSDQTLPDPRNIWDPPGVVVSDIVIRFDGVPVHALAGPVLTLYPGQRLELALRTPDGKSHPIAGWDPFAPGASREK